MGAGDEDEVDAAFPELPGEFGDDGGGAAPLALQRLACDRGGLPIEGALPHHGLEVGPVVEPGVLADDHPRVARPEPAQPPRLVRPPPLHEELHRLDAVLQRPQFLPKCGRVGCRHRPASLPFLLLVPVARQPRGRPRRGEEGGEDGRADPGGEASHGALVRFASVAVRLFSVGGGRHQNWK